MATSLTSGKLTVNNLTLMDLGTCTVVDQSATYHYYLPSGGSWIYPYSTGFMIGSGGSEYTKSNQRTVAYSIRFS